MKGRVTYSAFCLSSSPPKNDGLMGFEPSVRHYLDANGLRALARCPFWSKSSNGGRGGKKCIVREMGMAIVGVFSLRKVSNPRFCRLGPGARF